MDKKILVIDDDEAILDAVRITLETEGYEVEAHESGAILQSLNTESLPKLILMDMLLAGLDGRHLVADLKKNANTQHIPVIMLSAHPSARQTVGDYGVDDFLEKPFDIEQLLSLVEKYIN